MIKFFLFSNNSFPAIDWAFIEAKDKCEAEERFLKDFKKMPKLLECINRKERNEVLSGYHVEEKNMKVGLIISCEDLKYKQ